MAGTGLIFVALSLCLKVCYSQETGYPQERSYRRYHNHQFGFNLNFPYQNQNPKYLNQGVSTIRLQPINQELYSFNNRPKQMNQYYEQYGRPVVYPNYPQRPQQWNWGGNQVKNPVEEQNSQELPAFDNNGGTNGVRFPGEGNNNQVQPTNPAFSNHENYAEGTMDVNFPENSTRQPSEPMLPPTTLVAATLPPLVPVTLELEPVFTSAPAPAETTLPPLTPAPATNEESAFASSTLPPLTPVVPQSQSRSNVNFGSTDTFNEPCERDGVHGSCVPLFNCELYSKLLTQARSNPQVVSLLRTAHCGFDGSNPKVCCPAQGIPDQPPTSPTAAPRPLPTEPPKPDEKAAHTDGSDYIDALPQPPVCGKADPSFTKIVGGLDAKLGDLPWMALLGYRKQGYVAWQCGGSLVSSKHVLTAAHCIHNLEKSLYVVRLGELDLSKEDEGATPVDVLIKKKIHHPDYSRNTLTNDIGMLVLEKRVQFTDLIKPICIPVAPQLRSNKFVNYNPFVAGWGALKYKGTSASILQVIQLPVVSNEKCSEKYAPYKGQITIDDRVLCAGYERGGKDACQGDSGGPLTQPIFDTEESTSIFYQIGVVSFGKKCAEPGVPGVYTRVTTFVPWIEEQMLGPNAQSL